MQDPTNDSQVAEQPEEQQAVQEDTAAQEATASTEVQETPAEEVAAEETVPEAVEPSTGEISEESYTAESVAVEEEAATEETTAEAAEPSTDEFAEESYAAESVAVEEEVATEETAAEVAEPSTDEFAEESYAAESVAIDEEAAPAGPTFGEQLQETLTAVRERLALTFGPLAERVGEATAPLRQRLSEIFAPIREQVGDNTWIYGVAALVVVVLIVALFIPPFSLLQRLGITGFTVLSAKNPAVSHPDGLTLRVSDTFEGRLRVRLESVPRADFLEGYKVDKASVEALLGEYSHLQVKSPYYKVTTRGKPKQPVMLDVVVPNAAEPWDTLDIYTWTGEAWEWVGSALHTENAEQEFIRATVTEVPGNIVVVQAGSTPQTVSTSMGPDDNIAAASGIVDEINPTGLLLGPDGGIIGNLAQQPDTAAYAVLPTLRNWAPGRDVSRGLLLDVMENTASSQDTHITNIVEMCTAQGFAGVEIDYRGVLADEKDSYTAFVAALADALHTKGARLTVVLQAPANVGGAWDSGGYDWAAIGAAADDVKVAFPDDAGAYGEGGQAQLLLDWATAQVPRHKLHLQVSSLSVEQRGDQTTYVSLEEALAPLGKIETVSGVTRVAQNEEISFRLTGVDSIRSVVPQEATGTYRIEYQGEGDTTYTVWLGTPASLAVKLQWAQRYHLGGVSVTDLLNPGNAPDIVNAVAGYRVATTPEPGQEVQVVWTVTSAAALIDKQTKFLNDPDLGYTWLVMAATDTYTVKAEIAGYEHGSIPIVVADANPVPTALPSPIDVADPSVPAGCLKASFVSETVPDNTKFDKGEGFVKSWTVSNSGTCDWPEDTALVKISSETGGPDSVPVGTVAVGETKEIQVELTAPEEDGSFRSDWALKAGGDQIFEVYAVIAVGEGGAPVVVAPVAAGGSFELGGQTHTLANPDKMHYAGMTWVKFQHKWGPGDTPGAVAGRIQSAHANGFKVLLSIPGADMYPSSIDAASYVEFLGGVAALGPDAIEVWNEQNIDREWPLGQINPAAYVQQMLAPAYSAIKTANPNVMVISGAPAPTGYFGGCGPNGCDDAPYIAGMLNAGAASYVDCVGIHYNEGIVPPSQTSGDPRNPSDHYTRYFWGMTNAYYNSFGGQRPLCFTELGYLSPEGYGSLPGNFAWAQDTSVTEQAAWLAEAASLSASSGKVRMMVIFNVDFNYWGSDDPQAGYAIIRPGGGCPACDSLHNVLGSR
jgi:spore germination protein YaaH